MTDFYKNLGIRSDATKEQIKKAYRKKSMKTHPDQGGDAQEFDSINKAYRVLVNEDSRARYDAGEDPEEIIKGTKNKEEKSLQILAQLFINSINQIDVDYNDIVGHIRESLQNSINEVAKIISAEELKKSKFEKALRRIKSKKQDNFFKEVITNQILAIDRAINQAQTTQKDLNNAKEFLADYSYDYDQFFRAPTSFAAVDMRGTF